METTHAVVVTETCCDHFSHVLLVGTEMQCLDAKDDFNEDRERQDDGFWAVVVPIGAR